MRSLLAALLAGALLAAPSAFAQQYKWVEKDGKVRYGDTPPPGVKATPLKGAGPAPAPAAAPAAADKAAAKAAPKGPMTAAEQEQAFRKRQIDADKAAEKAAQEGKLAAQKADQCQRAQANLRLYESGERIRRTTASGEITYLEDADRAQEISKTRQMVRDLCG